MPAAVDKAKRVVSRLRERFPVVDHAVRMNKHYGLVRGGALAGGVTYFGFLSFFPLLALAFAAVGYISAADPTAEADIVHAVTQAFPGIVGTKDNQINIQTFIQHKQSVGILGVVGLLLAGLGWLDALREALRQVFGLAPSKGNVVVKKLGDIFVLVLMGTIILLSAAVSSATTLVSDWFLGLIGQEKSLAAAVLLRVLAVVLALASDTFILLVFFTRLPGHRLPRRNILHGAVLGGVGIEILKQVASLLLKSTTSNPLYATFAIAVGLLVWINFLCRVLLYAASWAATGPVPTIEERTVATADVLDQEEGDAVSGLALPEAEQALARVRARRGSADDPLAGPVALDVAPRSVKHDAVALAGVAALVAGRRLRRSRERSRS